MKKNQSFNWVTKVSSFRFRSLNCLCFEFAICFLGFSTKIVSEVEFQRLHAKCSIKVLKEVK